MKGKRIGGPGIVVGSKVSFQYTVRLNAWGKKQVYLAEGWAKRHPFFGSSTEWVIEITGPPELLKVMMEKKIKNNGVTYPEESLDWIGGNGGHDGNIKPNPAKAPAPLGPVGQRVRMKCAVTMKNGRDCGRETIMPKGTKPENAKCGARDKYHNA